MHGREGSDVEFNGPVSMKPLATTCPEELWVAIKKAGEGMIHARFMPQVFGHRPGKGSLIIPIELNGERSMMELISSINHQATGTADAPLKLVAILIGDVRYSSKVCEPKSNKRKTKKQNLH